MRKLKKIFICILALGIMFCYAACGKNGYKESKEYFELSAFTDNSDTGAYDSKYFYRNDLTIFGADAACLYVPEGRHTDENGVDNYGGYYYMYPSGCTIGFQGLYYQTETDENGVQYKATNAVLRSKDLVNWELCGALDGSYSTRVETDDWPVNGIMAPDPIYDETTGKYFLYEQANSHLYGDDGEKFNECPTEEQVLAPDPVGRSGYWNDRFYLGIFISDYPTGPFVVATSENYYGDANQPNLNGKVITRFNPQINFKYDLGIDEPWGVIDAHPFLDDDGQLYMYFCHHLDTSHNAVNIWGMKMKDMITPDYSTMTLLIEPGYTTVTKNEKWESAPWSKASYDFGEKYELDNGSHGNGNEGAFVMAKNYVDENGKTVRRYILCYSGGGYNNKYYDMMQTISDDNPLGPFFKPKQYASSIIGTSLDNDWAMGTGHGCVVSSPSGDEMFVLGWSHTNDSFDAGNQGRWYMVDKVHWVENPEYGLMLYGNGPTKSLQPKMYDVIGMHNVAEEASVKVYSKSSSGAEYLNDGLFVSHEYYKDWEFSTEGETQITLTFDSPKTVGAVLVYNSYDYEYAFSGIDFIEFDIAEKPSWYLASDYVSKARVSDIKFGTDFIGTSYDYLRTGAACLASFNEIKVNSVTISVSQKIKYSSNNTIKISDIVILGK